MSFGTAILRLAITVMLIGAVFGALVWRLTAARRTSSVFLSWAFTAVALGGLGALRLMSVQQQFGFANARSQLGVLTGIFAGILGISLAPAAIALRLRARRRPDTRLARIAVGSGGWALLGLLLAVIASLIIDLSNVPFVPLPGIREPSRTEGSSQLTSVRFQEIP